MIEDDIGKYDVECRPMPNSALKCFITDSESRIAFYLLVKILRTPWFFSFFGENGFAFLMSHDGNLELARAKGVIPMVMGIDDMAHWGKPILI